jgi:hypothetical protein
MLYLFGRLALSDTYYFNEDFHSDEHPENQGWDPRPSAPDSDLRPAALSQGSLASGNALPLVPTKKPAAELQRRASSQAS